jgi:hypothetical protein
MLVHAARAFKAQPPAVLLMGCGSRAHLKDQKTHV